ncbi:transporter substrate-binding domain-containing protein [Marinobacter sp. CHS3-4]|uniref:substrate-binding periplasmic protein n=1 Tax=Marinobacter sp. CHS3-4 TaxID=3045174 RepID=UPI0024B55F28|nr:transporter substrate-binding domain-containing protein [Marinobacter sp. CHS3-4]MDI9244407.1 transporter substrate-binding domain-containing protein [Marinobacter sp. CHS3-4]
MGFGKDKPPFVFGRDGKGLEIDIFREALASSGHSLVVEHFDNGALVDAVTRGRVDAVATARSDDPALCRVEQFIKFENVAVSLADRGMMVDEIGDLESYRVVAWERAYQDLGDEFYGLFAPQNRGDDSLYMEHHSQAAQVKMFWMGRADLLVIDKVIFEWYRKQMPPALMSHRDVHFHSVFSTPTYYPALFRDKALCKEFREGLDDLKSRGDYERLYQSYIQ